MAHKLTWKHQKGKNILQIYTSIFQSTAQPWYNLQLQLGRVVIVHFVFPRMCACIHNCHWNFDMHFMSSHFNEFLSIGSICDMSAKTFWSPVQLQTFFPISLKLVYYSPVYVKIQTGILSNILFFFSCGIFFFSKAYTYFLHTHLVLRLNSLLTT